MKAKLIKARVQLLDESENPIDHWNVKRVTLGWFIEEQYHLAITFESSRDPSEDVCAYISTDLGSRLDEDDLASEKSKSAEFLLFLFSSLLSTDKSN